MTVGSYRLEVAPGVNRTLERLSASAAHAIVEFLTGPLLEAPERVGKPLRDELEGLHGARRGVYRVIYRVDDEGRVVNVLRVAHRADVYRPW